LRDTRSARARWSVRRTIVVALAMGLIGLVVGVAVYLTRERETDRSESERKNPDLATPPTKLLGLGYLPAVPNIALANQPGPFLAYAKRTNQEPTSLLEKAGLPKAVLDGFGVPLDQIDHVAGGSRFGTLILPSLTLVLVLRTPLADEDEFLRKLEATRA